MEGNTILAYILTTVLLVLFVIFLVKICFGLGRYREQKQTEILQATLRERDRTMKSISAEVHDNLSQMLNLASMTIHMVEPRDMKAGEYKRNALDLLKKAISDAKYIGRSLNTDYINARDLRDSLKQLCTWVNQTKMVRCDIDIAGERIPILQHKKLMVIRIVQEAVNNSIKHAKAENLLISLKYRATEIEVCIVDDGAGFDINNVSNTGIGIESMGQRAGIIGAKIEITSSRNAGTKVCLIVPV